MNRILTVFVNYSPFQAREARRFPAAPCRSPSVALRLRRKDSESPWPWGFYRAFRALSSGRNARRRAYVCLTTGARQCYFSSELHRFSEQADLRREAKAGCRQGHFGNDLASRAWKGRPLYKSVATGVLSESTPTFFAQSALSIAEGRFFSARSLELRDQERRGA